MHPYVKALLPSIATVYLMAAPSLVVSADNTNLTDSDVIQFSSSDMFSSVLLVKVLLASIFALAIGIVFIWVLKKRGYSINANIGARRCEIEIVVYRRIHNRIHIAVVQIDNTKYVIAQSSGGISLLKHEENHEE